MSLPDLVPLIKAQSTVREIVAVCCNAPDEAVTVTVEVTGGGDVPLPLPPVPPPQPKIKPNPMIARTTSIINGVPRRFRQPNRHRMAAIAVAGKSGPEAGREVADCLAVEMVTWAMTALPTGVTVVGLKEQLAPDGRPKQAKLTSELNPFCGVTVRFTVPLLPEMTVSDAGDVASVNVGGGLMVYMADATALSAYPLATATATASIVSVVETVIGPVYTVELALGVVPSVVK
jgi:hypothetical protein